MGNVGGRRVLLLLGGRAGKTLTRPSPCGPGTPPVLGAIDRPDQANVRGAIREEFCRTRMERGEGGTTSGATTHQSVSPVDHLAPVGIEALHVHLGSVGELVQQLRVALQLRLFVLKQREFGLGGLARLQILLLLLLGPGAPEELRQTPPFAGRLDLQAQEVGSDVGPLEHPAAFANQLDGPQQALQLDEAGASGLEQVDPLSGLLDQIVCDLLRLQVVKVTFDCVRTCAHVRTTETAHVRIWNQEPSSPYSGRCRSRPVNNAKPTVEEVLVLAVGLNVIPAVLGSVAFEDLFVEEAREGVGGRGEQNDVGKKKQARELADEGQQNKTTITVTPQPGWSSC